MVPERHRDGGTVLLYFNKSFLQKSTHTLSVSKIGRWVVVFLTICPSLPQKGQRTMVLSYKTLPPAPAFYFFKTRGRFIILGMSDRLTAVNVFSR
ncbi:hypothetical protein SAMN04490178_1262 [Propionispora vibrioides]|uniref:Uncharacterized protein n=1 Tax=Propionispora vibrioides TaxID=112903 RepID=A0A1H8XMA0_9FIRM|nr:hypothetical protein SAMN04490178_1262 [Propionispora vibrioides]